MNATNRQPPKWSQITSHPRWKEAPREERAKIRDDYFRDFVAPDFGLSEQPDAYAEFLSRTKDDLAPPEKPGLLQRAWGSVTDTVGDAAGSALDMAGDLLEGEEQEPSPDGDSKLGSGQDDRAALEQQAETVWQGAQQNAEQQGKQLMEWSDIADQPEFRGADWKARQAVRARYFDEVVKPNTPPDARQATRDSFFTSTEPDVFGRGDQGAGKPDASIAGERSQRLAPGNIAPRMENRERPQEEAREEPPQPPELIRKPQETADERSARLAPSNIEDPREQRGEVDFGLAGRATQGALNRGTDLMSSLPKIASAALQGTEKKLDETFGRGGGVIWGTRDEMEGRGYEPDFSIGNFGIDFTADANPEDTSLALDKLGEAIQSTGADPEYQFTIDRFWKNPTPKNAIGMAAEQGPAALVDMGAMLLNMPLYTAARTQEIAEDRAANQQRWMDDMSPELKGALRDNFTDGTPIPGELQQEMQRLEENAKPNADDYRVAALAAPVITASERLAFDKWFPGGKKAITKLRQLPGVAGRGTAIEGGQEALQESGENAVVTVGTEKGWTPEGAAKSATAGAIIGAPVGGSVAGASGAIQLQQNLERQRAWENAWRDQGMESPGENIPETTIEVEGGRSAVEIEGRPTNSRGGFLNSVRQLADNLNDGDTITGADGETNLVVRRGKRNDSDFIDIQRADSDDTVFSFERRDGRWVALETDGPSLTNDAISAAQEAAKSPVQVTEEAIKAARQAAADAGGDALSQTMAAQEAEQETTPDPQTSGQGPSPADLVRRPRGELDDAGRAARDSVTGGESMKALRRAAESVGDAEAVQELDAIFDDAGAALETEILARTQGDQDALAGLGNQLQGLGDRYQAVIDRLSGRSQQSPSSSQASTSTTSTTVTEINGERTVELQEASQKPRVRIGADGQPLTDTSSLEGQQQASGEPQADLSRTAEPQAEQAPSDGLIRRSNGAPFATSQSARASGQFRDNPGAEVVPDGDGFAIRPAQTQTTQPAGQTEPDAPAGDIRGEPIDSEFTAFSEDSGTRSVPRSSMPQVSAENRGALANFLNARGIQSTEETVPASSLKPTQAEFSEAKVQTAKERTGGDRAILTSSDGHILDGHHQWMARRDQGEDVRTIRLDATIDELVDQVQEFPSSEVEGDQTEPAQPDQPQADTRQEAPRRRSPREQASEALGGAQVGDRIVLGEEVSYTQAGDTYTVDGITDAGEVSLRNDSGGGTVLNRSEVRRIGRGSTPTRVVERGLRRRANGQPFKTEASARASQAFRSDEGASVVPDGDGFAVQPSQPETRQSAPEPETASQTESRPAPRVEIDQDALPDRPAPTPTRRTGRNITETTPELAEQIREEMEIETGEEITDRQVNVEARNAARGTPPEWMQDETVEAIEAHEQSLRDLQADMDRDAERADQQEGGESRYRATPEELTRHKEIDQLARRLRDAGVPVEAVINEQGLPSALRRAIERDGVQGRVKGAFHNGTIWLVSSNTSGASDSDVAETVLHEGVHLGLRKLLGSDMNRVLDNVYRDMPARRRRELEDSYAGQLRNKTPEDARRTVAEEYLAHLAETDPESSTLDRVVSAIRLWLRKIFGAQVTREYGRHEIVGLIQEASRASGVESALSDSGPRYRLSEVEKGLPRREMGDATISARFPKAVKKTFDPLTHYGTLDVKTLVKAQLADKQAGIIEQYPNFRPTKSADTPEKKLARFRSHAESNLLWLFDQVPTDVRDQVKRWYEGANRVANTWANRYGITDRQAAGVIAALSPQKDWFQNASLAERALDAYFEHQDTAWTPAMSETLNRIYGKKTYADLREGIEGKTLAEIEDPEFQGAWIRVFDETFNDRGFRNINPDGSLGDFAVTQKGENADAAWGTNNTLEKVVRVLRDGSAANINQQMGSQHKVRNFYNNIIDPDSQRGFVTIDTHAVAAGTLQPLAGQSREVLHNFGTNVKGEPGPGSNSNYGISGTYAIYAEAYRNAAKKRGVLPREMQSITWEMVRELFSPGYKRQAVNTAKIDELWTEYKNGRATLEQTRQAIWDHAGGIDFGRWRGSDRAAHDPAGTATYQRAVSGAGVPGSGQPGSASGRGGRVDAAGTVPGGAQSDARFRLTGDQRQRRFAAARPGRPGSPASRGFQRESAADAGRQRLLARFRPTPEFQRLLSDSELGEVTLNELEPNRQNALRFEQAIKRSKEGSKHGAAVYVYPMDEYRDMRLFMTPDGRSGFAIKEDGDIVSVFSDGGRKAHAMMTLATEQGGTKLDAFDTVLPDIYSVNGFKEVGRVPWDERHKPEGWRYEDFAEYNNGRPDVVFMEYDPAYSPFEEDPQYSLGDENAGRPEPARDRAGRDRGRGLAPLEGAPTGTRRQGKGPDPELNRVAEQYAEEQGIDLQRQAEYVEVDPERAERIADAYEAMEHDPQDPAVQEAYQDMIRQTLDQYEALVDAGYEFSFFDGDTDPYGGNPWEAMRDLRNNKRMAVYGTYDGYGTEGITGAAIEENPLLEDTGLEWPDQNGVMRPVTANDLFRAVHDAFGHGLEGAGFRARGEENAWQAHVRLFHGPAVGALTTETRGQNSWLNYGPYGETNQTAGIEDTIFAEQKVGLMPEWTWTEGRADTEGETRFSLAPPVDSPAFKRWFGDSRVVDENGDPQVVFHGSDQHFNTFEMNRPTKRYTTFTEHDVVSQGAFFTPSREDAAEYGGQVVDVYLSIQNPLVNPHEIPASSRMGDAERRSVEKAFDDIEYILEPEISGSREDGNRTIDVDGGISSIDVDDNGQWLDNYFVNGMVEWSALDNPEVVARMKELGYDGARVIEDNDESGMSWFVTSPSQVKAVDNQGSFDPENPDIRYRTTDSTGFGLPDEALRDTALRKVADKMRPIKTLQKAIREAGGQVSEDNDVYLAEEAFHGKTEEDLKRFRRRYVERLANTLARDGISQDELDQYLYARHAPERNRVIAERNPDDESLQDGGSGMTDERAAEIMDEFRRQGKMAKLERAAGIVDEMLSFRRDLILEGGLEEEGTLDAWSATYDHYVPLKGWAHDEDVPVGEDGVGRPRSGKGFETSGKESKIAKGRKSQAASPSTQAIVDTTESVIRRRKNEVGQALLSLVADNPNPDLWQVFTIDNPDTEKHPVSRTDPTTGRRRIEMVEGRAAMEMSDRYFKTKKNGRTYFIKIRDQRLMNAMRQVGPEENNILIRGMAATTRAMSSLATSLNPEFMVTNFSRDIQTAMLNLSAEQTREDGKVRGQRIVKQTMKDVPKAIRASYRGLSDKDARQGARGEWDRWFQEFLEDGAKTGYFDAKDLEGQAREIKRLMATAEGGAKGNLLKAQKGTAELVDNVNGAVENGVRLAAYVNARKAGATRKRAASLAKNMTVNFNRRGESSTWINALYMFFNASVQGTANFVRTMGSLNPPAPGRSRLNVWSRLNAGQKIGLGMVAANFMLSAINRMISEEDDDGVKFWDKVPAHVKERHMVLMTGGKDYVKIPLPYGYNVFSAIGANLEEVIFGPKQGTEAAKDLTLAALGSFNPLGLEASDETSSALIKNITPTVGRSIAQLALNEDWSGNPVYKEDYQFGTPSPDSSRAFRTTPEAYKSIAKVLNDITGGNDFRSGWADVSPNTIQHFVNFYGSGAWGFVEKSANAATRASQGLDIERHEEPFTGRVRGSVNDFYADQSQFYERYDTLDQAVAEIEGTTGREKIEAIRRNPGARQLHEQAKDLRQWLKENRDLRDRVQNNERISAQRREKLVQQYEDRMDRRIDAFNKRYNELMGQ